MVRPRSQTAVSLSSEATTAFAQDVERGLRSRPKRLSSRYFYDREGAKLFEEICDLKEYYLTRAEREILLTHVTDIAKLYPRGALIIELGSGNAAKTRILLSALLKKGPVRYLPIDISEEALKETSEALASEFPNLQLEPFAGEYEEGLKSLNRYAFTPKLLLWLGSSIGNLDRAQAAAFLKSIRGGMKASDRLLVGIDLRKSPAILERAYDDSEGVTARFNLNLLARINRELGGDFDLNSFSHLARYNQRLGRIEMYLRSQRRQAVNIHALSLAVRFRAGEQIHTENSYKYSQKEILWLARGAHLRLDSQWLDGRKQFSLNLFGVKHGHSDL